MRKLRVVLPAILVAGLLLVWGVQFATSAPKPSARSSTVAGRLGHVQRSVRPATTPIHTAPLRTYFESGEPGSDISDAALTPIGNPVTVVCPGKTGKCKIEIDISLQVYGNATVGNEIGAVGVLDGSTLSSPGGPYDELMADSVYQNTSFNESFSGVNHGTHHIQLEAATLTADVTAENFNIIIRVYKP